MHRSIVLLTCLALVLTNRPAPAAGPEKEGLDEFLSNASMVQALKSIGLIMLAQNDPANADHDANELRKNFWAVRGAPNLTSADADLAIKDFERDWRDVKRVIVERRLATLDVVGADMVYLKKSMDWYFGSVTARGPVLIRVSLQFNPDSPLTVHGIKVWSTWDEVKAATRAIQLPAQSKLMHLTADKSPATQPAASASD